MYCLCVCCVHGAPRRKQGVSQRFHSRVMHQAVIWGVLMGFCVGEDDCFPVYSKPRNRIENVNELVFVEIIF